MPSPRSKPSVLSKMILADREKMDGGGRVEGRSGGTSRDPAEAAKAEGDSASTRKMTVWVKRSRRV